MKSKNPFSNIIRPPIRRLFYTIRRLFYKFNENKFLLTVSGVVHVGANTGQERQVYSDFGLSVVWIEPIQEAFDELYNNIKTFKNQVAFKNLITDTENKDYNFHITNNNGQSSSIFELDQHKLMFPNVTHSKTITLKSMTLFTFFEKNQLDINKYQALILDTQGSELLVLKGSLPILKKFTFIKLEVADFEAYKGCCQLKEVNNFMIENGFKEFTRKLMSSGGVGNYYEIVYKKQS